MGQLPICFLPWPNLLAKLAQEEEISAHGAPRLTLAQRELSGSVGPAPGQRQQWRQPSELSGWVVLELSDCE